MSAGAGTSGSVPTTEKDKDSLWYFSSDDLANSPSRRHGIDADQELSYRQMTAYLIQEMGQRLQVSQLCINTAIVYMHRFYAFHSFTHFHRNGIAAASLFLAAKVEEQPRKLEHVIKAANKCLNQPNYSTTDSYYIDQAQDLVFNENVLLQTLGFDVAIDHPHTHVVRTCQLVKACKDLAQTSYFLASNSLHLTSMCLQYRPTVVACFCIYLACKWSRWEIPQSTEGKHWFHYVDKTVTMDLLKQLTDEFIAIYEKSPARLKSKLNSIKALAQGASNRGMNKDRKMPVDDWKMSDMMKSYHSSINTNDSSGQSSYSTLTSNEQIMSIVPTSQASQQVRKSDMHTSQHRPHHSSSSHHHTKINYNSGDVTDHKHIHKQQPYVSSHTNRARDSTQTHQTMMSSSTSLPSTSTSRSSMQMVNVRNSANVNVIGQTSSQRTVLQNHPDANFHKPRSDRINPTPLLHNVPQHATAKMSQKPETSRVLPKDHPIRVPEQVKHNAAKLYPSTSMGLSSHFGTNQHSLNTKPDTGTDMTRSLMNNQRSFSSSSSNNNGVQGALNYHQSQLQRTGSTANNKHDQTTKPISVHTQQHNKQLPSSETSYGNGAHDTQQHPQQTHSSANYAGLPPRGPDMHADDQVSVQFTTPHGILAQRQMQVQTKSTSSSMFSPDWNEKAQHSLLPSNNNVHNPTNANESYSLKHSANLKESPKRNERDLMKDKSRVPHMGLEASTLNMARVNMPPHQMQHSQPFPQSKQILQRKLETPPNFNELAGTSTIFGAGIKRPNDTITIKHEDDMLRDSKIRKVDADYKNMGEPGKLQVVNGIETNADLVRNLLKESLCTQSTFIKTEPIPTPSLRPPAELLEPNSTTNMKEIKDFTITGDHSNDQFGGKAEKKKKKDKHKHKEKDKSKEDRKKHKKDKDRHKDRERESEGSEPVKLKIPKEKLEGVNLSGEPLAGFKIKIPKDCISNDSTNSSPGMGSTHSSLDSGAMLTTSALKIKISKDKIEPYSGTSSELLNTAQTISSPQTASSYYQSFSTLSGVAHISGGKKKDRDRDRDRERDKDKKRNTQELYKPNGSINTSASASAPGVAPVNITNAFSKSQNSSKMQQLSSNMTQLFGESNDDDDDDEDDIVYRNYQERRNSQYQQQHQHQYQHQHQQHQQQQQQQQQQRHQQQLQQR